MQQQPMQEKWKGNINNNGIDSHTKDLINNLEKTDNLTNYLQDYKQKNSKYLNFNKPKVILKESNTNFKNNYNNNNIINNLNSLDSENSENVDNIENVNRYNIVRDKGSSNNRNSKLDSEYIYNLFDNDYNKNNEGNISEDKKIVIYNFNDFNNKDIKYSADSIARKNHILTKNGYIYSIFNNIMIKKNTDYYIDLDILQQFKYNKNVLEFYIYGFNRNILKEYLLKIPRHKGVYHINSKNNEALNILLFSKKQVQNSIISISKFQIYHYLKKYTNFKDKKIDILTEQLFNILSNELDDESNNQEFNNIYNELDLLCDKKKDVVYKNINLSNNNNSNNKSPENIFKNNNGNEADISESDSISNSPSNSSNNSPGNSPSNSSNNSPSNSPSNSSGNSPGNSPSNSPGSKNSGTDGYISSNSGNSLSSGDRNIKKLRIQTNIKKKINNRNRVSKKTSLKSKNVVNTKCSDISYNRTDLFKKKLYELDLKNNNFERCIFII